MTERLVDVAIGNGPVVDTFPITVTAPNGESPTKDYEEKALKAAGLCSASSR
jgi:hypothetical protein